MSKEHLNSNKAIEKIKELANNIDFAMLETNLVGRPSHIIPMSTKKVDNQGQIWFLSNATSDHNHYIEKDGESQLIYANSSSMEFMTLFGKSTITRDRNVIDELYGRMDDNWFEGKNDPNLTAICFQTLDGHYWDTKHGALVSLLKMGIGMVTGKEQNLGSSGSLNV